MGILLALLIFPQTRWLVRTQLLPSSLLPGYYERREQLFVQSHSNDYPVQLAGHTAKVHISGILDDQTFDTQQPSLVYARSLVSRFPESASLRANMLRYETREIHLYRGETALLENMAVTTPAVDLFDPPPTPVQLAAFDADAAAGERLDPDNAYFPFMRSIGLFAAHHDAQGVAAVQRASTKPVWREYLEDEVEGHWRINSAVYGGREGVYALADYASVLVPNYQRFRVIARIVACKAIADEQAGHLEAGLSLRRALARCGRLMAVHSNFLFGNLIGTEISATACVRPGGALPLKANLNQSILSEQKSLLAQRRLNAYCDYVTRIGHPEAALEAQGDYQTGQQVHYVTEAVRSYFLGGRINDYIYLVIAFLVGGILFSSILSLCLLSLVAVCSSRLSHFQTQRPLPTGAAMGFWSGAILSLLLLTLFMEAFSKDFFWYALPLVLTPLALAGFLARILLRLRRPITTGLLSAGVTLGGIGLLSALAIEQTQGGIKILATYQDNLTGDVTDTPAIFLFRGIFGLAIPLLLAIVLSIVSRVKRVPVSVGLVGGFRAVMPPLVLGLMLIYGGLVLWIVRQEARVNYGLEQSLHGEGQYLAQLTGETWPRD